MNLQSRDRKIRQYREKGKTLEWIATRADINISPERVRQIVSENVSKKDLYLKIEQSYKDKIIEKADYNWLTTEIKKISVRDRRKEAVIQRRLLIRYLVDKLGFSFFQVALLTKRHHSSIMNLYYEK